MCYLKKPTSERFFDTRGKTLNDWLLLTQLLLFLLAVPSFSASIDVWFHSWAIVGDANFGIKSAFVEWKDICNDRQISSFHV